MFYLLVFLVFGLLYGLFLSLVDPQYMPAVVRWGMAGVFLCLAVMASAAKYVENQYIKVDRLYESCKPCCKCCVHWKLTGDDEPCATCLNVGDHPYWEKRRDG